MSKIWELLSYFFTSDDSKPQKTRKAVGAVGKGGAWAVVILVMKWGYAELRDVRADVNDKHKAVVSQITQFNNQKAEVLAALTGLSTGMEYLKSGIDETKRKMEQTRNKLNELSETVAVMSAREQDRESRPSNN